jgi:flagellar biosynthesis protein FlhA
MRGYTVVDASTVLSTHLTEVLKGNMADLLSYGETSKLVKELPKEQAKLVEDIVPSQVSMAVIQRVLQFLLGERVSIRDLGTILEGVAEAVGWTRSPVAIVEHVRSRLARQLSAQYAAPEGHLPLVVLSPAWEQAFSDAIVGQGDDRRLAMAPSKLQEFVGLVRDRFEDAARQGEMPVLLTSAAIRPFVRSIVERFRSQTAVLSQAEIHPRARLKTVAAI